MNISVFGLWHLGCVTAACLADKGYSVTGLDAESKTVENLNAGKPPLFEPGLEELIDKGMKTGRLRFTGDKSEVRACDIIWVAFDTPVDENDRADVAFVENEVKSIFPYIREGTDIIISSQMPVGSTGRLEKSFNAIYPGKRISFYYSPENLRLGKAIDAFTKPARIIAGKRPDADNVRINTILKSFCDRIEWMSTESAEMTKHALNAFLATSVTFINELAEICEKVGADAKEVERGLKSEPRIGPGAYLGPGSAFAGGTLARDIEFLKAIGKEFNIQTHLFSAVRASNDAHKTWTERKVKELCGILKGKRIAMMGLTYKPGTDTLRRSGAVELCRWLHGEGCIIQAHDPAVKNLPEDLLPVINLSQSPLEAAQDASALIIATEWKDYRELKPGEIIPLMREPNVVDPNGFLRTLFENQPGIKYAAVGKP